MGGKQFNYLLPGTGRGAGLLFLIPVASFRKATEDSVKMMFNQDGCGADCVSARRTEGYPTFAKRVDTQTDFSQEQLWVHLSTYILYVSPEILSF